MITKTDYNINKVLKKLTEKNGGLSEDQLAQEYLWAYEIERFESDIDLIERFEREDEEGEL